MSRDRIDLGRALKNVGDHYVRSNPADLVAVRAEARRRRQRRALVVSGGVAVAAAAAIAVLFVLAAPPELADDAIDPVLPGPDGKIQELDVEQGVRLEGLPQRAAASGDSVYVIEQDGEVVTAVTTSTGEVRWSKRLGGRAADIVAGSDGHVWVSVPELNSIHRLHPRAGSASAPPITLPGSPQRLHVATRALRVTLAGGGIYRVPLGAPDEASLFSTERVSDVAMGQHAFWVLTESGLIQALDTQSGQPLEGIAVTEADPAGEITFAREAIWYGAPDARELVRIDEATGRVDVRTDLPGNYIDLDASKRGLWVIVAGEYGGSTLLEMESSGDFGRRRFEFDGTVVDLASDPEGVWILSGGSSRILYLR